MRQCNEILWMKGDAKYPAAKNVLQSVLKCQQPDIRDLRILYGNRAEYCQRSIDNYFAKTGCVNFKLREHIENAPEEISEARISLEDNREYHTLQYKILNESLPDITDLEPFYGNYSEIIRGVIKKYNHYKIKRECGIPSSSHLNRVGALVRQMKMDESQSFKYSTTAFMHDFIEDLLALEKQGPWTHSGIEKYDEFINENIPEELHNFIKLLTNHYDLVLNYVDFLLLLVGKATNVKNTIELLTEYSNHEKPLSGYVNQLLKTLYENPPENNVLNEIKWRCYCNFYIHNMAEYALTINDFRTFQIKAIDLSDNAHGRGALSMSRKIKNILKLGIWANQGYILHTTWPHLNNFVMELYEDALVSAEHMIIKDLLEPVSTEDFLISALGKIEQLHNIFYTD